MRSIRHHHRHLYEQEENHAANEGAKENDSSVIRWRLWVQFVWFYARIAWNARQQDLHGDAVRRKWPEWDRGTVVALSRHGGRFIPRRGATIGERQARASICSEVRLVLITASRQWLTSGKVLRNATWNATQLWKLSGIIATEAALSGGSRFSAS